MKRALACAALLAAGCATAPPARALRLEAVVGATQSAAFSVVHTVTAPDGKPPLRVRLTFPLSVIEVAQPMGTRFKIGGLELALIPDDASAVSADVVEKLAAHMGWADEISGGGTASARGSLALDLAVPTGDPDATAAVLEEAAARALGVINAALRLVGIPLPDGAVAPGDNWTGAGQVAPPGEVQPAAVERRYQLIADDGKIALVRVHADVRGAGVTGKLDGELKYDRALPLPVGGALRYQAERTGGAYTKLDTEVRIGEP